MPTPNAKLNREGGHKDRLLFERNESANNIFLDVMHLQEIPESKEERDQLLKKIKGGFDI